MRLQKQKGFTLIELIAVIAAVIGIALLASLLWSSLENSLANTCQTNLKKLQSHYDNWALACAQENLNLQTTHLNSMNGIVAQWNAGDCSKYGALIPQPASCPPR